MTTILFILILSFLVIIHEFGHYVAAKWAKIKVDEFGLGYPPKVLKLFRWKKTDFTLNWIPFGGFVRMQGEEGDSKDKKSSKTGQFYQATVFKKLVIILAGVTVNFIFGVIAFAIVFSKTGIPQIIPDARIGEISIDSPAQKAGIKDNVNIVGFQVSGEDKVKINSINLLVDEISNHKGETVKIFTTGQCEAASCDQAEHEYEVYLRTSEETPENQGSLGVVFDPVIHVFYSSWEMPFRSILYGLEQAVGLGIQIVLVFYELIKNLFLSGQMSSDIAGPVGIVHQAQSIGIFKQGFLTTLSFSGMLSINLAVMNILPFPPLDGGRALFVILELLFKKKRTEKIEYYLNYGGYFFLLGLIIFVTIKDVLRIFG